MASLAIFLQLDGDSSTPIYLQIVQSMQRAIASGRMAPGEQLPSTRALAIELRVNLNTVARAYRELASLKAVEARRGLGMFVSQASTGADIRLELLERALVRLIKEARELGVAQGVVTRRLADLWDKT